ncbi:MAG: hypothetical protein FJX78_05685, partial [Armatimonadetes bacterium]|nr:hypothetical protein [Armatimonadota bacterium]
MNRALPFLAAAVLLLPLFGLGLLWVAPAIATGGHRAYPVLAVNHLGTLGWASLVAMAAMHQMFPAVLGATGRPGWREAAQLAAHAAGVVIVVAGFLTGRPTWIAAGGAVILASTWTFAAIIAIHVWTRKRWLPLTLGIVLSVAHLTLAVTWGFLMGANWTTLFWPALLTTTGLGVHVAMGVGGWFLQLIVSVSYYLLPRFTAVRSIGEGSLSAVLVSINAAIALFVVASVTASGSAARSAALLLAGGGLLWARDIVRYSRQRRDRGRDLNDLHWRAVAAFVVVLAAGGIAWAIGAWRVHGATLSVAVVVSCLVGIVSLTIMGQIYKVTPFLMWFYRYGRGLSMAEIPKLPDPYAPAAGYPAFWLCAAGAAGLAAAVLTA